MKLLAVACRWDELALQLLFLPGLAFLNFQLALVLLDQQPFPRLPKGIFFGQNLLLHTGIEQLKGGTDGELIGLSKDVVLQTSGQRSILSSKETILRVGMVGGGISRAGGGTACGGEDRCGKGSRGVIHVQKVSIGLQSFGYMSRLRVLSHKLPLLVHHKAKKYIPVLQLFTVEGGFWPGFTVEWQ